MVDEGAPRPIGLLAEARVRWLSELEGEALLPERTVVVRNEATAIRGGAMLWMLGPIY